MVSPPRSLAFASKINSFTLSNSSERKAAFNLSLSKVNILAKLSEVGINLAILSASNNGKSNTRAVSLTEDLAAIVP